MCSSTDVFISRTVCICCRSTHSDYGLLISYDGKDIFVYEFIRLCCHPYMSVSMVGRVAGTGGTGGPRLPVPVRSCSGTPVPGTGNLDGRDGESVAVTQDMRAKQFD